MRFCVEVTRASGDLHLGATGGDFRVGLAHHAVAAAALGRIEAGVGALDQRLRRVVLVQVATPIEIVTRPRCSPVERFISSLLITARRMWSATVIAERSSVCRAG